MDNELQIVEDQTVEEAFLTGQGLDSLVKKVKEAVDDFQPDLSTATSRKKIASDANKVTKFKVRVDGIGKKVSDRLKKQIETINGNRKSISEQLDKLKVEARKPLSDWEEEISKAKTEATQAAAKDVEEHYQFTKATSHQLLAAHLARPAPMNVLTATVKNLSAADEIKKACAEVVKTTNDAITAQASELSGKLEIIQDEAGDYLDQVGDLSKILNFVPEHIRFHVRDVVQSIQANEEAQKIADASQPPPADPAPILPAATVENQFAQQFEGQQSSGHSPRRKVPQPIEAMVSRHLFDHYGIAQEQARAIAEALVNNKIPGIQVSVNQSVA